MRFLKYPFFILATLLVISCTETQTEQPIYKSKKGRKDTLKRINKYLVKQDAEHIKSYAERRGWAMTETATGLWYEIYQQGKGQLAQKGQIATFNFSIELLDGTKCYSSDSLGVKRMKIGHGNVESGLEQALLLMHKGDKAHLILPPYMAHGLLGDFDKIPARASIVYNIELLNLLEF